MLKKATSKAVKIKILNRMNNSYEIFKNLSQERLVDIMQTSRCEKLEGDNFESFKLSNTDKMALHKALKEKMVELQKSKKNEKSSE